MREAAEVVFEGGRSAELAADLVLGLDQVGGDVAGAAQLGELLEVRLEADLPAALPLPFEVDLDHLGQRRQAPGTAGRDLVETVCQEPFIPALIELDQPRLEHLAIVVGEVGESGIPGHLKTPRRAGRRRIMVSGRVRAIKNADGTPARSSKRQCHIDFTDGLVHGAVGSAMTWGPGWPGG